MSIETPVSPLHALFKVGARERILATNSAAGSSTNKPWGVLDFFGISQEHLPGLQSAKFICLSRELHVSSGVTSLEKFPQKIIRFAHFSVSSSFFAASIIP